jgi:hypothetical protein
MKVHLNIIVLFFAITFHSFSQIPGYRVDTAFPSFDLNFLIIKSTQNSNEEFRFLKSDLTDFLEKFPNPDKNEDFYYEMQEVMARLISYGASELYFLEGKLTDFRFQDSKFSIGNGESFIKVGDHYSEVEKIYPSYKTQFDTLKRENIGRIFIIPSNNKIILDEGLAILFDLTTGKITDILF